MPSIQVKRKVASGVWDAWKLTTESFAEVLALINERAVLVELTETSLTFKNNPDAELISKDRTLNLGDWIVIPCVTQPTVEGMVIIPHFLTVTNEGFLQTFEEIVP